MARKRQQFSAEFKQDAVNYYYSSGKTYEEVCKELQISQASLSKWIKAAKENNGIVPHRGSGNYASDEDKEMAQLRKELRDTKDALEILKKALSILNK